MSGRTLVLVVLVFMSPAAAAQLRPGDLTSGYLVHLELRDHSELYGIVFSKPLPDRIVLQTRYGKLEIPLADITIAVDLRRYNSMFTEINHDANNIASDITLHHLNRYLRFPKQDCISHIETITHDHINGARFLFEDSLHLIVSTDWGELYLLYSEIQVVKNYSCNGDDKYFDNILPAKQIIAEDIKASQGFLTPNGFAFGSGNNFFSDYLLGGLQMNYAASQSLSVNLGGLFLPLKNPVTVVTGGAKYTPVSLDKWHFSIGTQELYSHIIKTTDLGLAYAVLTFGNWESNLSLFAGYTIDRTDSLGYTNTKNDVILVVEETQPLEKDLKLDFELFFISDFNIVPLLVSLRYYKFPLTVDVGFAFSLFDKGNETKTIGEYVFNVPHFPFLPLVSLSYHF